LFEFELAMGQFQTSLNVESPSSTSYKGMKQLEALKRQKPRHNNAW